MDGILKALAFQWGNWDRERLYWKTLQ